MASNITVHVVAPFHSRLLKEKWSHCAFTQIALKQIQIFKALGARVIDYSNYGSESVADDHVQVLGKKAFNTFFSDDGLPGHKAEIGSPGWSAWVDNLSSSVAARVTKSRGRHIIVHTFGDAASRLLHACPTVAHLEAHVGYDRAPFGANRVYVSEAWRHFLWGKYPNDVGDRRYSWVIHPYYDVNDWPKRGGAGGYIAFMGRIVADKGMNVIQAIATVKPEWRFKVAGAGDIAPFKMPDNVEHVGVLPGADRARFLGDAAVHILPTEYIEPCAGSVIEGMLCGTPAVTSSWGGFTETIEPGVTGYRAATLQEWIDGIELARKIDRRRIAARARERFTLEAATTQYGRVFEQLLSLRTPEGWYARRPERASALRSRPARSRLRPPALRSARARAESRAAARG